MSLKEDLLTFEKEITEMQDGSASIQVRKKDGKIVETSTRRSRHLFPTTHKED